MPAWNVQMQRTGPCLNIWVKEQLFRKRKQKLHQKRDSYRKKEDLQKEMVDSDLHLDFTKFVKIFFQDLGITATIHS